MRQCRICLSLYGTLQEISAAIASYPQADLFEIRLDLSEPLDVSQVQQLTDRPIILTSIGNPDLLPAAASHANYLDVGPNPAVKGSQYIVSYHGDDEDPQRVWNGLSGEHITKIALETGNYEVIRKLLELNHRQDPKAICFAMGEIGSFSRILALFKGAPWIYAGVPGKPTGPGQFNIEQLLEVYKLARFESEPLVFGILGDPVAHSRSPFVQNQMFAKHDLPWIYLPFLCKDLGSFLHHAPYFGITGLSVTHPYKEVVIQYLDEYSQEVKTLRACNTIYFQDGSWKGINTDVAGIQEILQSSGISVKNKRVMILGAGGAARAIAAVGGPQAQELIVLNRNAGKAQELASIYGGKSGSLEEFGKFPYDILFQATSLGMQAGECPVDPYLIRKGTTVIDAIYEPQETMLLQKARELGCKTFNGEAWFQAQAEAQFHWWRSLLQN